VSLGRVRPASERLAWIAKVAARRPGQKGIRMASSSGWTTEREAGPVASRSAGDEGPIRGGDEGRARVDLVFSVAGAEVPVDHGYALFGAIARALGEDLHRAEWLAVAGIRATPGPRGLLVLPGGVGELRIRLPPERVAMFSALRGRRLDLRGYRVRAGDATVVELTPGRALRARIVTTKVRGDVGDAEVFRRALSDRLRELGVHARMELGARRVLQVAGDRVVGYQVSLHELNAQDSLRVQRAGLGGRRRFGCGVFLIDAREREAPTRDGVRGGLEPPIERV
jgi:CRISPR-associated protein Cas6